MMEFHERVRAAYEHTGLGQGPFAALVRMHMGGGFSQQALSKLMRPPKEGQPAAEKSVASASIAHISGVRLDWLLREEGPMLESQAVSDEAAQWAARCDELGLSVEGLHRVLCSLEWPEGLKPPKPKLIAQWLSGERRPVDMIYRGMLYKALGLDEKPILIGAPEARTEIEQEVLNLVRMSTENVTASFIALWKSTLDIKNLRES